MWQKQSRSLILTILVMCGLHNKLMNDGTVSHVRDDATNDHDEVADDVAKLLADDNEQSDS